MHVCPPTAALRVVLGGQTCRGHLPAEGWGDHHGFGVMEAKARGATIIHVDPRFTRTIPTLFDLLPGYIPMPHSHQHEDLASFIRSGSAQRGFWGSMSSYVVSLLKAYWGDAATAESDFRFD